MILFEELILFLVSLSISAAEYYDLIDLRLP